MPMFEFQCAACGARREHLLTASERDAGDSFPCEQVIAERPCPGRQHRCSIQSFAMGKAAYQCHAILGNGQKVRGHFGKSAAMLRGYRGKRA